MQCCTITLVGTGEMPVRKNSRQAESKPSVHRRTQHEALRRRMKIKQRFTFRTTSILAVWMAEANRLVLGGEYSTAVACHITRT